MLQPIGEDNLLLKRVSVGDAERAICAILEKEKPQGDRQAKSETAIWALWLLLFHGFGGWHGFCGEGVAHVSSACLILAPLNIIVACHR